MHPDRQLQPGLAGIWSTRNSCYAAALAMTIRRLPSHLVNQIAAGEVVERPAAAMKELVENALDAGAGRIAVTIAGGGLDLIVVADDGCGMDRDAMLLAVERHATSKLPDDRLDRIVTLGFRGEALPSIASVSRLSITSRPAGALEGWRLVIDHGEVADNRPAGAPLGTEVAVEGLFVRTPARRKFLRGPRAESAACLDALRRLALARPEVAFRLVHDGRTILDVASPTVSDKGTARAADLFGPDFSDNAAAVNHERNGFRVTGLAGLPTITRASAEWQYLVVNRRPVRDRLLAGALRAAYSDLISRGRHPIAALWIDGPVGEIDVNVHPAKTEVRFADAENARALLVGGVRRALDLAGGRSATGYARTLERAFVQPAMPTSSIPGLAEGRLPFATPPASAPVFPPATAEPDVRPLGAARAQLHRMWVVAETPDALILVDQHAAHERVVMERLKAAAATRVPPSQHLLVPEVVEITVDAADRLEAAAPELERLGLLVERFGPEAVLVRAVPAQLGTPEMKPLLRDLADELAAWGKGFTIEERLDEVCATIACHGSVRAGRSLSLAEMDALLRGMEATPHAGQCNHGRPTYVTLSKSDIERLFHRR